MDENQLETFDTTVQDDKVYLNFAPETLSAFTKWGKFVAVMTIIEGALSCLSILAIPIAIFELLAGIKLFNTCSDMKAYMTTGNSVFSLNAGENLYKCFKNEMIYFIVSIALVIIGILLLVILIPIVLKALMETPEVKEAFEQFIEQLKEMYPDLPIESLIP